MFEKAKLAEQKSTEKQEEKEETLKDYENKIAEYVDGTRNETSISNMLYIQNNRKKITKKRKAIYVFLLHI